MADELETEVLEIIARKKALSPADLRADMTFAEIGLDSLDAIDLVFTFESAYNVTIPDELAVNMKTVSQATEALRQVLNRPTDAV